MVVRLLVFLLLSISCVSINAGKVYITYNGELTSNGNENKGEEESGNIVIAHTQDLHAIALKRKDDKVVEYDWITNPTSQKLNFKKVSHEHVFTEDCKYEKESFNAFTDMNILYIVAKCGDTLALTRTIIYSGGILHTPPGPLLKTKFKTKSLTGITSFNNKETLLIGYDQKLEEMSWALLHNINKIATGIPDISYNGYIQPLQIMSYPTKDGRNVVVVKHVDQRFNAFNVDNKFIWTKNTDCLSASNKTFTYFGCPEWNTKDFSIKWTGENMLSEDDDGKNSEQQCDSGLIDSSMESCSKAKAKSQKILFFMFGLVVYEYLAILFTILAFSFCILRRRSRMRKAASNKNK